MAFWKKQKRKIDLSEREMLGRAIIFILVVFIISIIIQGFVNISIMAYGVMNG